VTNRKAGEFFYSLGIVFAAQSLQNKMQITFHINQTRLTRVFPLSWPRPSRLYHDPAWLL